VQRRYQLDNLRRSIIMLMPPDGDRPAGQSRQLTSLAAVSMMAATASGRDT
jgi:hypothetical protein